VALSLAATGHIGSWLAPGAARARTGRVRNGGRPANSQVRRKDGKARPWPGRGPAWIARWWPGAGPGSSGPPGPRWPYPSSLIAAPRYSPFGINFRLRSRNAVSVTRNEFRPPAPYAQTRGPVSSWAGHPGGFTPDRRPPGWRAACGGRRRPGPGGGSRRPHAPRPPKTRSRTVITQITERARKVPESGTRGLAGTLSRGYLAAITPLICDVRSP